jgi:hypothetical protein
VLTLLMVAAVLVTYRWRHLAGTAAWGAVAGTICLHMVMEAPVWHLLSRVSVVSGSTGWHRYILIDSAIRHFGEWMFMGCRSTVHWGAGLQDITNQYILEGVRGGFVTFVLFCAVLITAGRAFVRLSIRSHDKGDSYLAWCSFVCLIGHCVSFLGVAYLGQIMLVWYLLLATAGWCYGRAYAKTEPVARKARMTARAPCACP